MKTSKRILAALLAALTLFSLTACASRTSQTQTPAQSSTTQQPAQQETPDTTEPEAPAQDAEEAQPVEVPTVEQPEDDASQGGKTLVVYYSASGNTAAVAGYIADALGADTFELVPETPYSSDDLNWTVNGSRKSPSSASRVPPARARRRLPCA